MILCDHLDTGDMWSLRKLVRDRDVAGAEAFLRARPPLSGDWTPADLAATLAHVSLLEGMPA